MELAVIIGLSSVAIAGLLVALLAHEERDRQYRRANGLPPRRYHDVTDIDPVELHLMNIEQALWRKK